MTINDIIAIGRQIAAETAEGGNTAARVGGVIEAIGEILKNQDYMSWQPAGNFDIEEYYEKNDQVFDEETNSCYVSLQTDNVGHPVNENDESYEEGWWMKVIDGASVLAAAAAATQAATEANQAAEAARGIVYQAVDDHLDTESLKPVANQVVTQAINNLSENLQDVEEDVFDATNIISDNEFDLAAAAATTNNVTYITPSKTEDGAKWTIKTAAPTISRQGQISIPRLTQGKTYKIAFDVENTINATITCALDYKSSQSGSNVVTAARQWLSGDLIANTSEGHFEKVITANYPDIDYICFRFVQPAKNQYLLITNITLQEVSSVKNEVAKHKEIVDGMTIGEAIDTESDVEISDDKNNVIMQLKNGHVKTKNFDSESYYGVKDKFKGKHLAIIGDSISTYEGYIPAGWRRFYTNSNLTSVNNTYWMKLCNALGMTYNNCAYSASLVSGDSTATTVTGGQKECPGCSDVRINALNRDGKTPDILLIYLGLNDWGNDVPIGDWGKNSAIPAEGNITTFAAAYALMITKIRTLYPTLRIFCCTIPSTRNRATTPPIVNTAGIAIQAYNDALTMVARTLGCDVIDLNGCGLNYISIANLSVDGVTHPNIAGHDLMYKKVLTELIAKY